MQRTVSEAYIDINKSRKRVRGCSVALFFERLFFQFECTHHFNAQVEQDQLCVHVALHIHDGSTDLKGYLLEAVQWHQLRKNIHLETSARNSRRFGNVQT